MARIEGSGECSLARGEVRLACPHLAWIEGTSVMSCSVAEEAISRTQRRNEVSAPSTILRCEGEDEGEGEGER